MSELHGVLLDFGDGDIGGSGPSGQDQKERSECDEMDFQASFHDGVGDGERSHIFLRVKVAFSREREMMQ